MLKSGPHDMVQSEHVSFQYGRPVGGGCRSQWLQRRHSGRVQDEIDLPQGGPGMGHDAPAVPLLANIADRDDAEVGVGLGEHGVEAVGPAGSDHDVSTHIEGAYGEGPPDARRRPDDEDSPTLQPEPDRSLSTRGW